LRATCQKVGYAFAVRARRPVVRRQRREHLSGLGALADRILHEDALLFGAQPGALGGGALVVGRRDALLDARELALQLDAIRFGLGRLFEETRAPHRVALPIRRRCLLGRALGALASRGEIRRQRCNARDLRFF
jgi:hypothetical protein